MAYFDAWSFFGILNKRLWKTHALHLNAVFWLHSSILFFAKDALAAARAGR